MNKLDYLKNRIGQERFDKLMSDTELKKSLLETSGVESKETAPEGDPQPDTQEKETTLEGIDMEVVLKAVGEYFGMEDLSATIEELKASHELVPVLAAELEKALQQDDEKMADLLEAPASKAFSWLRASQSKETLIPEDEEKMSKEDKDLLEQVPGMGDEGWLSQATGTHAIAKS